MQINESELAAPRGKVIGIGRVKIPKMPSFNYEIPLLSFIVIKKEDNSFVSTCIHLQIDGYGKNVEDARIDMANNIWFFLKENFNNEKCKENCWVNILDLFKSNNRTDILWDKYHTVQVMLAERGVTTDKHSQLEQKIQELKAKVAKLEEDNNIKKLNIDELNKLISEIIKSSSIIRYEEAA
jgi:hypothetical protein